MTFSDLLGYSPVTLDNSSTRTRRRGYYRHSGLVYFGIRVLPKLPASALFRRDTECS